MITAFGDAWSDLKAGFRLKRVWIALAHEDIGDQHRRTTLGPLWLLLNYLILVGTFVVIFHRGGGMANAPAYIALGFMVWYFISDAITQSVQLFAREESFIKGTPLPLSVYVMRMTMQILIRGAYTLAGCVFILAISRTGIAPGAVWAIAGIALIVCILPAVIIVFAFIGAFFPDMQFVVSNIVRIGLFLTPVFWAPGPGNTTRNALYLANPFTYFLEIVRDPVLNGHFPVHAFLLCAAIGAAVWVLALILLGTFRKEVVFVL